MTVTRADMGAWAPASVSTVKECVSGTKGSVVTLDMLAYETLAQPPLPHPAVKLMTSADGGSR